MADLKENDLYFKIDGFSDNDDERRKQVEELIKQRDTLLANMKEKNKYDEENRIYNIRAGILGFAIGDAMGVPVEFVTRNSLKQNKVTNMMEYGSHNMPIGTWSDDTSLMLATMDSIQKNESIDCDDIMANFKKWFYEFEYTATNNVFDVGVTTSKAIQKYISGISAINCGGKDINENGNGSLMRILPLAYYFYYIRHDEKYEIELISNVSSITHAHEISKLGCKIYIDYVKKLLETKDKIKAYEYITNYDYSRFYSNETIKCYERILNGKLSELSENDINSTGYVVSTLEACIWCTLKENNYRDAILTAVNLGEDTDTIGALTGGINGILYGENSIPKEWLDVIKNKTYIEEMCNLFSNSFSKKKFKNM